MFVFMVAYLVFSLALVVSGVRRDLAYAKAQVSKMSVVSANLKMEGVWFR